MLIYNLVDIKNYFDQLNDGVDTIKDIKEFVCFEFVWITDDSPIYGYLCSSTFSGTQFMICANTLEDAKNIDEKLAESYIDMLYDDEQNSYSEYIANVSDRYTTYSRDDGSLVHITQALCTDVIPTDVLNKYSDDDIITYGQLIYLLSGGNPDIKDMWIADAYAEHYMIDVVNTYSGKF